MLRTLPRFIPALCLSALLVTLPACDSDDNDPEPMIPSIVDLAQDSPNLSILVDALTEADLVATLQGDGPFTVFAPDNDAFTALLDELGVTAEELLARADLAQILTYHVVAGEAFSNELADGQILTTLEGSELEVDITDEGTILLIGETNTVEVKTADIEASNGVIHIIDRVLLPAGPFAGGPLEEAAENFGDWFFIETDGAQCRDGSATGFGVRLQEGAENLVIYLEGGGACFNDVTCATNPSSFGATEFAQVAGTRGNAGIFNTSAMNPVGDWNAVYVPYCTGDVHGGSAPDAVVPGVDGTQQFVGHRNIELYLAALSPYLDPEKVLVTGASAGGFGSLVNFAEIADTFADADPYLVDDSGPIFFSDDVFSPTLGGSFVALYNFPGSFPTDAAALFQPDGLEDVYDYYDNRYPDATFGLTSYLEDQTIRFFFGFGQADGEITGPEYAAGLEGIRDLAPDSWGTYYAPGNAHTFIGSDAGYFGTVDGTALSDWLGAILDGTASDVGMTP